MNDIICLYKPCGQNENCIGCINDPQHREMTAEQFFDCQRLSCGGCVYCNPSADLDSVESTCKRLDHKHLQFAKPWFKSYDCGQRGGCICSDFKPKEWQLWLYRHYKKDFLNHLNLKGYIPLCIDKDWSIRYYVKKKDFYNNTFLDADNNPKWVFKKYYKQSRKSVTGYKLITEYKDGKCR